MRKDLPGGTVCLAETRPTKLTLTLTFIFVFGYTLQGCRSETRTGALIEFSKIPPAAQGGQERVDTIAGRVIGARPGQRIVIYAKSGPWWVQPLPNNPFTPIQADSRWSTTTHLGYEYAALLVEPSYHPPPNMDVPPTAGGPVVAVIIAKGSGSLPPNPTN